ncbi:MAG: STAS domain-containing protein [Gammaproteobacteria bacterium]|nr:STAS domain-containing protein [Gammaproteobacteria bacterium]
MKLTPSKVSDCLIVTLEGRLDSSSVSSAAADFTALARGPESVLLIDMSGVDVIDSSGLSLLLSVYRRRAEHDKSLALCGLSASVRRLIELTRLHRLFQIHDTRERALKSMNYAA